MAHWLLYQRLRRLAQDFAQQHLADQKLPQSERCPYTLVFGMRSWLFGAFRQLLREAPAVAQGQPSRRTTARGLRTAS